MPQLPRAEIKAVVKRLNSASTSFQKGKAFEDYICLIFKSIPGIEIARRNEMNTFLTEEIDVVLWNSKREGLDFLPNIILIECKNWSSAVGSEEVSYFKEKLESRSCEYGFLIAANGITGDPDNLLRAHSIISRALLQKTRIMIIKLEELQRITDSDDLVNLIKEKLLELTIKGTNS